MTIKRHFLGFPDYSGASLEDIITELENFLASTGADIHSFEKLKKEVEDQVKHLDEARLIGSYIKYWTGLLVDFQADFERLLGEIPKSVEERHLETMRQIFERSSFELLHKCNNFEEKVLERSLGDERLNSLADQVFELASQRFNDNGTLKDLSNRLRAFAGSGKSKLGSAKDQRANIKGAVPLDVPQGLSWGDVTMRFLDEENLEIRAGRKPLGAKKFTVLGFENKKTERPDTLWVTLWALGQLDGELSWKMADHTEKIDPKMKKNISILRNRLKNLFGIYEDPFYPYIKKRAYKTKFRICIRKKEI